LPSVLSNHIIPPWASTIFLDKYNSRHAKYSDLIITFPNNIFLIDRSVPIPLSDIFPYDNTVIACFDIYITICGISLIKKQKRRYIFRAYRHEQFILGQEPLTSKMSYGRDSGYGRNRGRSYGGGGSIVELSTEVLLLQNQLKYARNMK